MKVPLEIVRSPIKGGFWIETGLHSGEWHKDGKLIASWSRGKDKKAVVTWHQND
jgi:hypothetical protein